MIAPSVLLGVVLVAFGVASYAGMPEPEDSGGQLGVVVHGATFEADFMYHHTQDVPTMEKLLLGSVPVSERAYGARCAVHAEWKVGRCTDGACVEGMSVSLASCVPIESRFGGPPDIIESWTGLESDLDDEFDGRTFPWGFHEHRAALHEPSELAGDVIVEGASLSDSLARNNGSICGHDTCGLLRVSEARLRENPGIVAVAAALAPLLWQNHDSGGAADGTTAIASEIVDGSPQVLEDALHEARQIVNGLTPADLACARGTVTGKTASSCISQGTLKRHILADELGTYDALHVANFSRGVSYAIRGPGDALGAGPDIPIVRGPGKPGDHDMNPVAWRDDIKIADRLGRVLAAKQTTLVGVPPREDRDVFKVAANFPAHDSFGDEKTRQPGPVRFNDHHQSFFTEVTVKRLTTHQAKQLGGVSKYHTGSASDRSLATTTGYMQMSAPEVTRSMLDSHPQVRRLQAGLYHPQSHLGNEHEDYGMHKLIADVVMCISAVDASAETDGPARPQVVTSPVTALPQDSPLVGKSPLQCLEHMNAILEASPTAVQLVWHILGDAGVSAELSENALNTLMAMAARVPGADNEATFASVLRHAACVPEEGWRAPNSVLGGKQRSSWWDQAAETAQIACGEQDGPEMRTWGASAECFGETWNAAILAVYAMNQQTGVLACEMMRILSWIAPYGAGPRDALAPRDEVDKALLALGKVGSDLPLDGSPYEAIRRMLGASFDEAHALQEYLREVKRGFEQQALAQWDRWSPKLRESWLMQTLGGQTQAETKEHWDHLSRGERDMWMNQTISLMASHLAAAQGALHFGGRQLQVSGETVGASHESVPVEDVAHAFSQPAPHYVAAARALSNLGCHQTALPRVRRALKDQDVVVRTAMVHTLSSFPSDDAAHVLVGLMADDDEHHAVRGTAANALHQWRQHEIPLEAVDVAMRIFGNLGPNGMAQLYSCTDTCFENCLERDPQTCHTWCAQRCKDLILMHTFMGATVQRALGLPDPRELVHGGMVTPTTANSSTEHALHELQRRLTPASDQRQTWGQDLVER